MGWFYDQTKPFDLEEDRPRLYICEHVIEALSHIANVDEERLRSGYLLFMKNEAPVLSIQLSDNIIDFEYKPCEECKKIISRGPVQLVSVLNNDRMKMLGESS